MKTPFNSRLITLCTAAFAAVALLFLASCKKEGADSAKEYYTCPMHPSVALTDPKAKCPFCHMDLVPVDYYTCTMHPSVKLHDPKAKCPICSMELVPVMKKPAPSGTNTTNAATAPPMHDDKIPSEFVVPLERQQLIGVTWGAVSRQPFARTLRAAGTVAWDKRRHWDYVARTDGYVRELFVVSRGEPVEKEAPLLTLQSIDLLKAQIELVELLKLADPGPSIESARKRLRLMGVTDSQIAELEKSRQPRDTLTLLSPAKGVVQDVPVDQGRRVTAGDHLVDVVDLSSVWVWARVYQDDLPLVKTNLPVTITTSSYPGENFSGTIALVDPLLDEGTRTARVRIDVENSAFKLRPEMFVDVELKIDAGEGLAVPSAAVLPTGTHNIAFVSKGEGRLEPRYVELGRKFGDFYELKSGLAETDRIVTSANFLIDAEARVQGALKAW